MTTQDLTETPEYILRYFAPMLGLGNPYAEELIRRMQIAAHFTAHEENKRRQFEAFVNSNGGNHD